MGFLWLPGAESYSLLQCEGFSLWWVLSLQSTGSRHAGFLSCGTQAWLPRRMWNLLGPGIEPVSPALTGGFLTTGPPGKPTCTLSSSDFHWASPHLKCHLFWGTFPGLQTKWNVLIFWASEDTGLCCWCVTDLRHTYFFSWLGSGLRGDGHRSLDLLPSPALLECPALVH